MGSRLALLPDGREGGRGQGVGLMMACLLETMTYTDVLQ